MGKRVFSGAALILMIAAVVIFNTSFPWILNIAVAVVCVSAVYELSTAAGLSKNLFFLIPSVLVAAAIPFVIGTLWTGVCLFLYTIVIFIAQLRYHEAYTFRDVSILYSMALLIPLALGTAVPMRDQSPQYGVFSVVLCVAAAWVSDAGAFFAGRLFGKHKLCPNISPKKTTEGVVGGFVLNFLFVVAAGAVAGRVYGAAASVSYLSLALIAIGGTSVSILGDLSFSLIKRGCHIKDFGNVIPGHGGILDRFDSVIFTTPFVYYVTMALPVIS